jgi:hypothetical protein
VEVNLCGEEIVFVGEEDRGEKVFWHISYSETGQLLKSGM